MFVNQMPLNMVNNWRGLGPVMSFRGTTKQHLIEYREAADIGVGGAGVDGKASGVAMATGAPRVIGGNGRGVWRSRREASDRRRRRLWFRRWTFR